MPAAPTATKSPWNFNKMDNLKDYEVHLKSKGIDPYALMPDDNPPANQVETFIDTNSPEQRIKRLERQKITEP